MKIFPIVLTLAFATACVTSALAETPKQELTPAQLQAEAKITEAQARGIALAKVAKGKIQSIELEQENGRLLWSVDIVVPGTGNTTEVAVDAKSGAVVDVQIETPQDEKKEALADSAADASKAKAKR